LEYNLADLFECVADHVPQREAVICGDRRLTFAQLDERASRFAHALADRGVQPGEHVGLYLYSCAEFLEAMLGCYKLRAVPVNVNYRYVDDELAYLVDDADLVALVYHRDLAAPVAAIMPGATKLRLVVEVPAPTAGELARPGDAVDYEELLASGSPARDFAARSGDDLYLLYTGGTTGLPRGVMWRQEDIFFAALGSGNPGGPPITRPEEIGEHAGTNRAHRVAPFLQEGDPGPEEFVALSLGPLMHASGQWLGLGTLLGGGKVVLYPDRHMDMRRVLTLVERERVVMLTLVGDASARPLVEELDAHGGEYDISSLRLLGSGGSILTGEVKDRLLAALPAVLAISEAVGSSESPVQAVAIATPGNSSRSLEFAPKEGATIVVDDALQPVAAGTGAVGRLATRGRVPLGYYNDPAKSAQTFVDIEGERWALPGDMATVDADGTIRLLGRGSMCINTGGEKVYPEEVEAVLKAHPAVADAVVVGAPDERWGERVVAVVQPNGDTPPSVDDLREHCRTRLAGYKAPRAVCVVDEVQRSPSGKPDYRWAKAVASLAPQRP
jgi:acyl-CoA synthetase (AMP-forming)/AMP-acid ligase II